MTSSLFPDRLTALARLSIRVGVNLQRGQELIVTAPLEAASLVRRITENAYREGAKQVTCLYDDPDMIRARFENSADDGFDYAAGWLSRGVSEALEQGAARLYVAAPYPDLLSGIRPEKIVRAHAAMAAASAGEARFTAESRINWSTVPFVTDSWARTVFPDLPAADAYEKLWDAVFQVTRADWPDPLEAWREHNGRLNARRDMLQAKKFAALHLYDGQTDLRIGLADGHRWVGGTVVASNGVEGVCNLPTEEVFTCPHPDRANGRVFFSRPLALAGTIVEDLQVEFRNGSVASVAARKGVDTFEKLISSDEGARRLGEVGLVPASSLVAQRGTLFYNALLDENAATHIAFGNSYAACLGKGAHGNHSSIHIDAMLGNACMSIDGISSTGIIEPLMRAGEFVI